MNNSFTLFPLYRIALTWITGTLLAYYHHATTPLLLYVLGIIFILYIASYIYSHKKRHGIQYNNAVALAMIGYMGYTTTQLSNNQKHRYVTWMQSLIPYQACVIYNTSPLKNKGCTYLSSLKFIRVNEQWYHGQGAIHLFIPKCFKINLQYQESYLIVGKPVYHKSIASGMQNSYAIHNNRPWIRYKLNRKYGLIKIPDEAPRVPWPKQIRLYVIQRFKQYIPNAQTVALIEALLFGYKDNLSKTIKQAYVHTGTVHTLVVSGLHVGMIYKLFRWLFFKILRLRNYTIPIENFIITLLWAYTWLCGFSPPIVRATTMISMAKYAAFLKRSTNSYNNLCGSALLLLLKNSSLWFNLGFALSYLATLGIIYFYPRISKPVKFKYNLLHKLYQLTLLSLSAQIFTWPLTVYYFKQWPTYFILANWIIVPAIFLILWLSIIWIPCSFIPWINHGLAVILDQTVCLTNLLAYWMAKWPYNTVYISIPKWFMISSYTLMLICCIMKKHRGDSDDICPNI